MTPRERVAVVLPPRCSVVAAGRELGRSLRAPGAVLVLDATCTRVWNIGWFAALLTALGEAGTPPASVVVTTASPVLAEQLQRLVCTRGAISFPRLSTTISATTTTPTRTQGATT